MAPISDLFPEQYRSDFSNRAIVPGQVLRFHSSITTPPKIKICVLLAINNSHASVGYLFINSEINPNVFSNRTLRSLHLLLTCHETSFLSHDSWLDCSTIHEIPIDDLKRIVTSDPSCHLGDLPRAFFEASVQLIRNAPTIPRKLINKYFGS